METLAFAYVLIHPMGNIFMARFTVSGLIQPLKFSDVGSLILVMDEILEAQKFPQAFQRPRSFTGNKSECSIAADCPDNGLSAESVAASHGKLMTFDVLVISRRSSSWQGYIDWLDGGPREDFRSALEIIRAVDSHLSNL